MDDVNMWFAKKLYGGVDDQDKRFNYWVFVLLRGLAKLFRTVVFCAGVVFLFTEQWFAGFGCFLYLLWWKVGIIQTTLEQILFMIRGYTDDQLLKSLRNGAPPEMEGVLGGLREIAAILREIRDHQTN